MSADDSPSGEAQSETEYEFDCGHSAVAGKWAGDVRLCMDCYWDYDAIHFGLEDYPATLQQFEYAGPGGTHVDSVKLLGLTEDRRAVYHNGDDGNIWICVPAHSRDHDTEDVIRDAVKDKDVPSGPAPPMKHDYHTLPDGDHIALQEVVAVDHPTFGIREYVAENAEMFRELTEYGERQAELA